MPNHLTTPMPAQKVFQRADDVTYAHDLCGNFTFLNEQGERMSGYSCTEARGMNIMDLLEPEIAGLVPEQILRNATEQVGKVYEIDMIAKDGTRVPLEVSMRIVLREGESIEIQGIAVPSVIRSPSFSSVGLRCLHKDFFFSGSPKVSDLSVHIFLS
ncbi:MAG: two-component system, cell cycle sensor histidine kinase and response regulator CckA [Blastocatellia bacterium]|nr:two-component system, cell cycle sensor histidine kinase and response regulator CckA [Blastocatellia bacterium]